MQWVDIWDAEFVFFPYLKVECGCKDLHSGVFGGSVHEAMTDLITLMGDSNDWFTSHKTNSLKKIFGPLYTFTWLLLVPPSGSLVDKRGKIMIPGMYDSVAPLTDEEQNLYQKIEFDLEEYCQDVGVKQLLHGTKASSSSPLTSFF